MMCVIGAHSRDGDKHSAGGSLQQPTLSRRRALQKISRATRDRATLNPTSQGHA